MQQLQKQSRAGCGSAAARDGQHRIDELVNMLLERLDAALQIGQQPVTSLTALMAVTWHADQETKELPVAGPMTHEGV